MSCFCLFWVWLPYYSYDISYWLDISIRMLIFGFQALMSLFYNIQDDKQILPFRSFYCFFSTSLLLFKKAISTLNCFKARIQLCWFQFSSPRSYWQPRRIKRHFIYMSMKIAQLCSHLETKLYRHVYKHTGFLKEVEITGVKYMIKSQINPHLNINCAICFSNIETQWGALRNSLSPWK